MTSDPTKLNTPNPMKEERKLETEGIGTFHGVENYDMDQFLLY